MPAHHNTQVIISQSHPTKLVSMQDQPAEHEFRKQPVSPPPGSDSDMGGLSSDGHEQPRPKSLLSSLLSDHSSPAKRPSTGYTSGPSAPSSAPSTAFSSPRAQDPVSILRRGSMGSDGEPFHLPFAHHHVPTPLPKALPLGTSPPPVDAPRAEQERIHASQHDDIDEGNDTDQGYEEDSEDGFSDDEPTFMMQAMARAREARARAPLVPIRAASVSPPRPAIVSPSRRGRGHIRVDPDVAQDHKSCTRHYSPPPSDARSSRSAPPGPRDGRAGSPVPSKHEDEDDDDDDEDDEERSDEEEEAQPEGEGRAAAAAVVHETTVTHDDEAVMSDASVDEAPMSTVRTILRRASEHLPSFRRPSFALSTLQSDAVDIVDKSPPAEDPVLSRARSLGARSHPVGILSTDGGAETSLRRVGILSADEGEGMARSRPMTCPVRRGEE